MSGLLLSAAPADTPQPFSQIPKEAISHADAFIVAYDGEAYLYNYEAGIVKAPFLDDVYKSFGLSYDSRYFLYLKSNGKYPAFGLYRYDLVSGQDVKIAEGVHYAAWSPASHEAGYISLDRAGVFHVLVHDFDSGTGREIFAGMAQPEYLEWSPGGERLLYVSLTPLTPDYVTDQQFRYTLHTYSVRRNTASSIPDIVSARFDEGTLLAIGKTGAGPARPVPNPDGSDIRDFLVCRGEIYATILEDDEMVVKRLDRRANAWEFVATGHLFTSTSRGVVIREFHQGGVTYSYVPVDSGGPSDAAAGVFSTQATTQAMQSSTFAGNWKMPFQGSAFLVQGGALYANGSCDGGPCMITSHRNALGYALDWQQVSEQGQGNWHVLAVEDGTVVATVNTVTCNTGTPACVDYQKPCNDPSGGLGNYVSIAHPDGSYSFYGHMKAGSVQVTANQTVTQGTYLGDQGHSGVAATYNNYHNCGDHLHFQRQTGPAPWTQSMPTDFSELPCGLTCTSSYLSANVENAWPAVSTLTVRLSPSTILGAGTSAANRVILASAAPAGGTAVALASSNPSAASAPASVTVPAGSTSATFSVTARAVSSQTPVTITATVGNATASATLTIAPVSLARMNPSQFTVTGGATVNGNELDLTGLAPSPFAVTLRSSAPAVASVPSTATVAAGSAATFFSITTAPVASSTAVTITATDGVVTNSAVLQVAPGGTSAPPPAPVLSSPANGATGVALAPSLAWRASSSAASYDVYFGTSSSPPLAGNTAALTFSPGTLSANTKYFWKVVAKNGAGANASAIWSLTTQTGGTPADVRVNAGGPAFTDPLGRVWSADSGFTVSGGTSTASGTVLGASAPALYQTARWGNPPGSAPLTYQVAVANGTYTVSLKFVDGVFTAAGQRTFHIVINGVTVASNFDIAAQAGSAFQAVDVAAPVNVTAGQITVQLVPVISNPKICAIEIIPGTPAAPTVTSVSPASVTAGTSVPVAITGSGFNVSDVVVNAGPGTSLTNVVVASVSQITATLTVAANAAAGTNNVRVTTPGGTSNSVPLTVAAASGQAVPVRVNAGGPAFTDPLGQVWSGDNGFTVSGGISNTTSAILGASAPALYQTARWGNPPGSAPLTYQVAVPNGPYTVNLKFVDAAMTGAGQRLFNIVINGQAVASNFDIFAQAGSAAQAVDFAAQTNVTGGQLTVQLVPVRSNPKVTAIEIIPGSVAAPTITSVTPASAAAGITTPVAITGSGFISDVVVNAGQGISVTNVAVASPTRITANFAVAAGTPPGSRNVKVSTPGGTVLVPFATQ